MQEPEESLPISEELKVDNEAITSSDDEDFNSKPYRFSKLSLFDDSIDVSSLERLEEGIFLNDEIINMMLVIMLRVVPSTYDKPLFSVASSFFYS